MSETLRGIFAVRPPYPLWTNRRFINGIIELHEVLVGDEVLEETILGVMNDVRGWLISNGDESYDRWADISLTPRSIIRAVTFGTVASLYARRIYAPAKTRSVVSVAPVSVNVKVITSFEAAMEYWEDRMNESLDSYLTLVSQRIYVSTIDEEPVFTMEDIPVYNIV
jgi:hypothetical protein